MEMGMDKYLWFQNVGLNSTSGKYLWFQNVGLNSILDQCNVMGHTFVGFSRFFFKITPIFKQFR